MSSAYSSFLKDEMCYVQLFEGILLPNFNGAVGVYT
jgi:hypothetical protein